MNTTTKTLADDGLALYEDIRAGQPELMFTCGCARDLQRSCRAAIRAFARQHGYSRAAAHDACVIVTARFRGRDLDGTIMVVRDLFDME